MRERNQHRLDGLDTTREHVSLVDDLVRTASADAGRQAYEREIELATAVFKSEDAIEGPMPFMQKREPQFKGK